MKLLFFSDVHGSAEALRRLQIRIAEFQPDQLETPGDLLYHGPRNGVFAGYTPVEAAELLNRMKPQVIAARGNCDAEVDQLMLDFPMQADYSVLFADGRKFFLTHGHLWNETHLPPLEPGSILVHGHTHIPDLKRLDNGIIIFNPGSITLPKQNHPASYGTWDGAKLEIRALADGVPFRTMSLTKEGQIQN